MPLAGASRGVGKRALWDSIIKFQKNGYIMGAGTGSQALADKDNGDGYHIQRIVPYLSRLEGRWTPNH